MMPFNRKNKFGKYLREAIIPGWGSGAELVADTPSGAIKAVGGRRIQYDIEKTGLSTDYSIKTRTGVDRFGNQARYLELEPHSGSSFYRYSASPGDLGPPIDRTFTVVGIVKCVGDGAKVGNEDPRIYSKDLGTAANDHDLMIGLVTGAFTIPRARVRVGTSTVTLIPTDSSANDVGSGQWLLIALSCSSLGADTDTKLTCLHGDGRISTDAENKIGNYAPRTTTDEALWANAGVDDNPFHGGILGVWFFDGIAFNTGQLQEFWENPWQAFAPRRVFVPLTAPSPITTEQVGGGVVEGSISFGLTADKVTTNTLTAESTASFLISLLQEQTVPSVEASISFDITGDQTQTNTATRPVTFNASIDLTQLETNVASRLESALFNLSADQAQTNTLTSNNIITFSTNLDFQTANSILATATSSLALELAESMTNTKDATASNIFNFNADQAQTNQLDATAATSFDTSLTYAVLNTLSANKSISFDLTQTFEGSADGAGEINAAIAFAASMAQLQTNTLTIDKAVSLITNLDAQFDNVATRAELVSLLLNVSQQQAATRAVPGTVPFDITLDQNQTNLATRVALATLNAAVDAQIQTQLDYNLFVNLATTLSQQLTTDGQIDVSVTFGVDVDKQIVNAKTTAEAISLALQANYESSIHLAATGEVSLGASMNMIQAKQLIGQGNITFGHLIGLASIGSADLGADITFATVQDMQVNEFLLEFTIVTPRGRTFKVYIEDRTTIVDESERTIIVGRQN